MKLRGYQSTLKSGIEDAWLRFMSVLAVLCTGGGKTVIFSSLINEHNGASAAVVHRKEIVGQISLSLAQLGVKHRIVAPSKVVTRIRRRHLKMFGKSFIDQNALPGVVSVQTLTSKSSEKNETLQTWVQQVTLAVFDEGHHYVKSGLWGKAVDVFEQAKKLFVTATPERADGKGLGAHAEGYAEAMVEGPSMQWLIDNGYLCRFEYKAPKTDFDPYDIPLTASGELNKKELRKRASESCLTGDVVQHYKTFCDGKRAIVFATDVESAQEMVERFTATGVQAAELNGGTDAGVRDKTLDEFEAGNLKVLVNVDLFDEGFDVPAVEAVIMARLTESLAKFLQMVGRALRVVYADGFDLQTVEGRIAAINSSPKPKAVVVDAVGNWEKHGAPNLPRVWSLDNREKGSRSASGDLIPQRVCDVCTQPYEKFYTCCPHCGAPIPEPVGRAAPAQVDGDLMELDVEAMVRLFEEVRKANVSTEEFAASLYEPNENGNIVPPKFHGRLIRKHRATKHRRKVLEELIAWWFGVQADRDRSETYRRFYHRFGVDVASAFKLDEKGTDALINKIQRRFNEDLFT